MKKALDDLRADAQHGTPAREPAQSYKSLSALRSVFDVLDPLSELLAETRFRSVELERRVQALESNEQQLIEALDAAHHQHEAALAIATAADDVEKIREAAAEEASAAARLRSRPNDMRQAAVTIATLERELAAHRSAFADNQELRRPGQEAELRQRHWLLRRRAQAEALGRGRVGYVYVGGMCGDNYCEWREQLDG